MPLVEQLYCSQQINVPPTLPTILKQFCKAAIRTQPYDLLKWSGTYFRALANGEELPIKFRLEYPPPSTESGLTLGFLKVLLRQFGDYNKILSIDTISRRWDGLCLDNAELESILSIGGFGEKCEVKKFLSIAVGLLTETIHETMIVICELFTHEPEGGSAMIPFKLFMELYGYLAGLKCAEESSDEPSSGVKKSTKLDYDESKRIVEKEEKSDEKFASIGLKKLAKTGPNKGKRESKISQQRRRIPGIGPRLTQQHISNVASWMSDCARLQEGMVGPRNLRHFECPSLDEPETHQPIE